jgi:hypothetical protein
MGTAMCAGWEIGERPAWLSPSERVMKYMWLFFRALSNLLASCNFPNVMALLPGVSFIVRVRNEEAYLLELAGISTN